LGNGCKGCIHKALSEIHNSNDTIYIIAGTRKKHWRSCQKGRNGWYTRYK
jgi:hypothetical protein